MLNKLVEKSVTYVRDFCSKNCFYFIAAMKFVRVRLMNNFTVLLKWE